MSNKSSIEIEIASSNASVQPYYMKFLRCANCAHDFEYENELHRPITLPICGHTMCTQCIDKIRHQTTCPLDEKPCGITGKLINELPTNYPLLIIRYDEPELYGDYDKRYGDCECFIRFDAPTKELFYETEKQFIQISLLVKETLKKKECESIISRYMIDKIFVLLNNQIIYHQGRLQALAAATSLIEQIRIEGSDQSSTVPKILEQLSNIDCPSDRPNWLALTLAADGIKKLLKVVIEKKEKVF